jgi:phage tail sheath protein FI
MPFALSPGVTVIEKDFSSIIPAVSTSAGAFAGQFQWGPVAQPTTVISEDVLVQNFGKPTESNYKSFFTAANFLSYTNNLIVNRIDNSGLRNAVSAAAGEITSVTFTTPGTGYKVAHAAQVTFAAPTAPGGVTATGEVVLAGSAVLEFSFTGGEGYSQSNPPLIIISNPELDGGVRAEAVATVDVTGAIVGIALLPDKAGSGYLTAPSVQIVGENQTAVITAVIADSFGIRAIKITNAGSGYITAPSVSITVSNAGTLGSPVAPANLTANVAPSLGVKIKNTEDYLSYFRDFQQSVYGMFAARYPGTLGNGIQLIMVDSAVHAWAVTNQANDTTAKLIVNSFSRAPGTSVQAAAKDIQNDELHLLVLDSIRGTWTGVPSQVLEKYTFLSKIKGVTRSDGTNVYYRDAVNASSKYIWIINTPSASQINDIQNVDWNQSIDTIANTANLRDLKSAAQTLTLSGGQDYSSISDGDILAAYLQFNNTELFDISLVATGDVSSSLANSIINEVAEVRKDCVVFVSPRNADASPIVGVGAISTQTGSPASVEAIRTFKSTITNSTYAFMDSGAKYQYDRYNDVYRWIPLNGDMAGLCARTDYTSDPWFSPGGFTRGQVKNVVKLGFNPSQTDRDNLYKEGVNPVVTFPGQGTILFGDKTFTSKPSAFDHINVRRLFIVLEKAVATAAKFQLFEFNDDFTRAQFRNLVEPFLRNVQGRRGIVDFRVKCDATNNTGEVIDRNEFVASIFIKPNRSINYITLNFVAARSSVSFDEIGG